jgi:predicted nucleotidyltransferase
MVSNTGESGSGVFIQFPLPDQRLFRNQATEDILLLLLRNPHQEFTVTELRTTTGHGGDTIQTAITVLEAAQLIQTRQDGRKKLIAANRDRFHNPDDPLLQIPQEQFRDPVKRFLDRIDELAIEIAGVILFGSVARGDADRTSDIDLQVIVDHTLTEARRQIHDIRQDIEEQEFNGERYELQVLVESVETAEDYGDKLQEIFSDGITLRDSDKLTDVQEVVFHGK